MYSWREFPTLPGDNRLTWFSFGLQVWNKCDKTDVWSEVDGYNRFSSNLVIRVCVNADDGSYEK